MGIRNSEDMSIIADMSLIEMVKYVAKSSTVLTSKSEGYAESIRRWSDAVEQRADIVVQVTSAEDISALLILCRAKSIPFVVCGGKHSTSGASSIARGLVIDLCKLRKVTVNAKTKTVTVEGGAVWKDVDEAAGKYGLAAVGGTVNHTGVGGLTLGGGYGWLSGRYGLTIDNLLSVVMVLADGRIVRATKDEYPDLFWAVRGAGAAFGVAIEFTFQAHDQRNSIWAGQMVFAAEKHLEAVVEFANHLAEVTDGDSAMVMGITAPPFVKGPAIITTVFYNGPKEAAEEFFAPLIKLGPLKNTTGEMPYSAMNGVMNHAVDYGGRKVSKGASFVTPIRPSFVRSLVEELQFFHQEVPGTKKSIVLLEFFHPEQWCKVPKTATAFANRGRHQNAMLGPFWTDKENDQPCRRWARHMAKLFQAELERVKVERGNPESMQGIGQYGNYDGLQAKPREIFGVNYDRLTKIKAIYDPDNRFNSSGLAPAENGSR